MAQGVTTQVSVDSMGDQANGWSGFPCISADGRFVAFESIATNLVSGDTGGYKDVFVHDCQTGETSRASVGTGGIEANGDSGNLTGRGLSISGDGRYVAFASSADNLVPGDTNGLRDIFVHDRQTSLTWRVSVDSNGGQANDESFYPWISADGRYVAFASWATNLVPGDLNGMSDVFVHDNLTGQTSLVSVTASGVQGNLHSFESTLSADGRYVAFASYASNLDPGDTGYCDIFIKDRLSGSILRVTKSLYSGATTENSRDPMISADGRYVAFYSDDAGLVYGDTNDFTDVFVHDVANQLTRLVSVDSSGAQANERSWFPSISADGQSVVFSSFATNLVPFDTNGVHDIFVHDLPTGQVTRVSVSSSGAQASNHSYDTAVSADGRYVAFESWAANLVPGDTNGTLDIFLHDRTPDLCGSFLPYCIPAAPNSVSATGAKLDAHGCASHAVNTLTLDVVDLPPGTPGIFFYGPYQTQIPFGNGWVCVGGPVQRVLPVLHASPGGTVSRLVDLTLPPFSVGPAQIAPGSTWNFQYWYRDPGGGLTGFNFSSALQVTFAP